MPHISVTILPGCSREEKIRLARRLKEAMSCLLEIAPVTISVSIKDLPMDKWNEFIIALPSDEIIIPEAHKECRFLENRNKNTYS